MCFLQADQLWALQSQLDRAYTDAAAYKRCCFKQNDHLQMSERNLLQLSWQLQLIILLGLLQDLKLAKVRWPACSQVAGHLTFGKLEILLQLQQNDQVAWQLNVRLGSWSLASAE